MLNNFSVFETIQACHKHEQSSHNHSSLPPGKLPYKTKPRAKDMEPQTCDLCGKTLASKISLHNHVRFVHEKRFKQFCHLCGMGFYSGPALERHLLSMHKENEQIKRMMEGGARVWRCEVVGCSTNFMKEEGLEEHRKRVHGGLTLSGDEDEDKVAKRYTCAFCGKGFWMKSGLQMHELIHKNEKVKPYECDVCGVKTATLNYLRNHRRRVHKIYGKK